VRRLQNRADNKADRIHEPCRIVACGDVFDADFPCLLLSILSLIAPVSAWAIVNVEQAIIGPEADSISHVANVAVNGTSGNTAIQKRAASRQTC